MKKLIEYGRDELIISDFENWLSSNNKELTLDTIKEYSKIDEYFCVEEIEFETSEDLLTILKKNEADFTYDGIKNTNYLIIE